MTIIDQPATMAHRLLPLPLTDLVLHETTDPERLDKVADQLSRNGVLKNPVLITQLRDHRWLIIDGAHRVGALRRIGVEYALTQVIPEDDCSIASWHHLVEGDRIGAAIGRSLIDRCPRCEPRGAEVPRGFCVAAVQEGRRTRHAWTGSDDVADAAHLMNRLFTSYSASGRYRRAAEGERGDRPSERQPARVAYRPWSLEDLGELTARGLLLPAGVTRFVAPGRVLGVDVPLDLLSAGDDGARLRGQLRERSFRYYPEPVYIAE